MSEETKFCPFCGCEILAVAKKCKHCKQFIPDKPITKKTQTKLCPYCGEEIKANAQKCKHCGEWLTENSSKIETGSKMVKCPFCGKAVTNNAEKCPNCGEWLKDENEELSCGCFLDNPCVSFINIFSIVISVITFLICFVLTVVEDPDAEQFMYGMIFSVLIPVFVYIGLVVSMYLYFFPTIYAKSKNHPQFLPIFFVNLFFGETVIGWIGALVWAGTHRQGRYTHW